MLDRHQLFDITYALAARDGRENVLFGAELPRAREAFARSLACDAFPELWFEIPLLGEPWFDFHALTSVKDLHPGMQFDPATTGNHPEAFEWFANQSARNVRQLALSWDIGSSNSATSAIQLLITSTSGYETTCGFLEAAHRQDAVPAYRRFVKRLPQHWFACYTGVFPGRLGDNLRIECIPSTELQRAYADDASLLEAHLRQVGFRDFDSTLIPRCQLMAQTPFQFELQFNVDTTGSATSTLGASIRFAMPSDCNSDSRQPYDQNGAAGEFMSQVESWGLADSRWRLLKGTIFAKRATLNDVSNTLYCYPTFIKLRWRDGQPLDAKAYLIAGLSA